MNMDSRFEGKNQYLYEPVVPEMKSVGKVSLDWNLNDWRWDGDLFTAKQLTSVPTDCRNRQLFPVDPEIPTNIVDGSINLTCGEGSRELEKRRRGVVVDEGLEMDDEIGSLHLNLGGQVYPIMEGDEKSGKKTKITSVTTSMSRAVCQVEDCRADLSNAKDYHRRHKVCDVHSKASKALVGNVMQRFCQQCSRFHVLQEFDEGKRSCRRRLAGHNRRRRKTHPDAAVVNGDSPNEERGSSYILMSLLRLLSNMHSNGPDHMRNIDVLSRLIGNLASVAGTINGGNVAGMINGRNTASLLEVPQDLVKAGTSGAAQNVPNTNSNGPEPSRPFDSSTETRNGLIRQDPPESRSPCETVPTNQTVQKCIPSGCVGVGCSNSRLIPQSSNVLPSRGGLPPRPVAAETTAGRNRLTNIDLNNVYNDVQDSMENPGNSPHQPYHPSSVQCDSLKSSPPQTSRNSDSTSTQSPSSSSGEGQSRTDRIVFKLFGKDPNDFPVVLRSQILNWLSHSPTEIESYIRPGCIILTICLRLENSAWDELCYNLGSSLRKLIASSNDSLWSTGWIYTRVRHSVAILYNGQVVLDVPLHLGSPQNCQILCVKPLAVSASANVKFIVKGFNLFLSSARLLCALEGKYLLQDRCYDLIDGGDAAIGDHELQQLSFSCHIPNMTGRGFIEVEDNGFGSCSFPFIVAEEEICSEICTLETVIEAAETADDIQIKTKLMEEKTRAMYFVQEMGWLLHRIRVKFRLGPMAPVQDRFHFNRYTSLVGFSMDHDWCAVTKKLLDIIFEGEVDTGEHTSVELALLNMSLLHKAVKRNCRPMVELLLNFVPVKASDGGDSKEMQVNKSTDRFLFRPDTVGPAGLTPLHVAASMNGYENVLDALTDDPGMVGLEAWKNAKDGTGLTPNDYASLRGHYSYIQLVQRKTSKNFQTQHVLDIPSTLVDANMKKQSDGPKSSKVSSFHTEKVATTSTPNHCGLCQQKLAYGGGRMRRALVYRPAMLSMVAIAAVCVCVALLFKSSPKVYYVFQPFSWESLEYGSI